MLRKRTQEEIDRSREEREFNRAVEYGERMALKDRLEKENGLENHKKKDRLWDLAWEYGHSEGYPMVEQHYNELAELMK